MLAPSLNKNDKQATWLIGIFSFVVFAAVTTLGAIKIKFNVGFDVHIFAKINAVVNSLVTILLAAALVAVKQQKFILHKRLMLSAMVLSIIFLISYICHHLLAGDTKYGGTGPLRYFYFLILITHIF